MVGNSLTADIAAARAALAPALAQRGGLCVLTGAGISAESGIATFRDALTGYWSRFDPMDLASEEGFRANPQRVWRWYAERRDGVRAAAPNAGHIALAASTTRNRTDRRRGNEWRHILPAHDESTFRGLSRPPRS